MAVRAWGAATLVNSAGAGDQEDPAIAALRDGGFVIAWQDVQSGDIHAQRYDAAQVRIGTQFTVQPVPRNQGEPSVTGLSNGGFVISLTEDHRPVPFHSPETYLSFVVYAADGSATTTRTSQVPGHQSVLLGTGESFGVAYSSYLTQSPHDRSEVHFSRVTSDGRILTDEVLGAGFSLPPLFTHDHGFADLARLTSGRIAMVWSAYGADVLGLYPDPYGLNLRIIDPAGPVLVSHAGFPAYSYRQQAHVEALRNDNLVVTWTDGDDIYARRFNGAAQALGASFLVNTTRSGYQDMPDTAALPQGGFVVVWRDVATGVIRGQVLDDLGGRSGGEFLIGNTISFDADPHRVESLAVSALLDGRFVVTWEAPTKDVIYTKIFDPRDGVVNGTAGDDRLYGANGVSDTISGGDGNDSLYGLDLDDRLSGGRGNDRLDGGPGRDAMAGGAGNDWYLVDYHSEVIEELAGEGTADRLFAEAGYALPAGVDIKIMSTQDHAGTQPIDLIGNGIAQAIYGNAGANVLNGGGGADTMVGWAGNDWYFVDNADDLAIEAAGGGNDRLFAGVSYALAPGSEIEIMSTRDHAGTAPINLAGSELANAIYGNAGDNVIDGRGGADTMAAFGGDDRYLVDDIGDTVREQTGGGDDRVLAGASWNMTPGSEIELLSTLPGVGAASVNLRGNELANSIHGSAGTNIMSGGRGNDTLWGMGGNDFFLFETALNGTSNVETIGDYDPAEDEIWLYHAAFPGVAAGVLPTSAFAIGSSAREQDDRIVYDVTSGHVYFDADGTGGIAQTHFAVLSPGVVITSDEFRIV